ncbi:MAG: hypothetical protein R2733_19660 [Acidimicrobiales bacterium]
MLTPPSDRRAVEPQPAASTRLHYRMSWILALLVLVPLATAAVALVADAKKARDDRERVRTVEVGVDRLVQLTELRSSLVAEQNWVLVMRGIEDLGMTSDVVESLSGIDVEAELSTSQAEVDQLTGDLELPNVAHDLSLLRSDSVAPLEAIGERYYEIDSVLALLGERKFDDLMTVIGELDSAADLMVALRVLDGATAARSAMSAEFVEFYQIQLAATWDTDQNIEHLIERRALRRHAMAKVERNARTGSETLDAILSITGSDEIKRFDAGVADLVANGGRSSIGGASITDLLQDLDLLNQVFTDSSVTVERYAALVEAAGDDATSAAAAFGEGAAVDYRNSLLALGTLAFVSLVLLVAAHHATTKPISALANKARAIRDGTRYRDADLGLMPDEIRESSSALDEAAEHLQLAERQARAIAAGNLDDPSLTQSATGQLGASLQHAVKTLTASMANAVELRHQIAHEATHDPLTGCANRRAILSTLANELAHPRVEQCLALLFFDLDGSRRSTITTDTPLATPFLAS